MKNHLKFLRNKRGVEQELYFIIIESVLVIAVFIAMFQWVNSAVTNESFEKMVLSRDLALTLNTIQYFQGNLEYKYKNEKIDLSKFNYKFADNNAQVLDPGKPLITSYPFFRNLLITSNMPAVIEKKQSVNFEINNSILTIK